MKAMAAAFPALWVSLPLAVLLAIAAMMVSMSRRRSCWRVVSGNATIELMRLCLCLLALAAGSAFASDFHPGEPLRGKLVVREGKPPVLETAEHKVVILDGDEPTRKVLGDQRLDGFDIEAKGHFTAPDRFLIDPIHTRGLLVRQGDKLRMVTYWCDLCSIRAYTPGLCACCQRETTLDLRDPDKN